MEDLTPLSSLSIAGSDMLGMADLAVLAHTSSQGRMNLAAPPRTSVVLGASTAVLLRGLAAVIEEIGSVRLVERCWDVESFLAACRTVREGVALVDASLAAAGAAELVERLKLAAPRMRVVVVVESHYPQPMRTAVKAGASGLICRDATDDEIRAALVAAARGQRYIASKIAADLAEAIDGDPLTDREMQVLDLLAQGRCNKSIARDLSITVGTVKTHVRAIMHKLDSHSRTQAVHNAYRLGFVSADNA